MTAIKNTDDTRIKEIKELLPPIAHLYELPVSHAAADTTHNTRRDISDIIHGRDDRLIVIVGPCSIHDPKSALEYASRLAPLCRELREDLVLVMRVYFEKPRTTVGWKGLINDPRLDGSYDINAGLRLARRILLDINNMGVPAATEFLDMITPQYYADLIAWGAIGARTTESQVHRELASGLSCPVGFKNGTDGNLKIAVDAVGAAARPHHFLSVTKAGHSAIVRTDGNPDCHVILRGGKEPNYEHEHVVDAADRLRRAGFDGHRVMIDLSHANSRKDFARQPQVAAEVAEQLSAGERDIIGIMVESHLVEGRQDQKDGVPLVYGQSITDACIGWDATVPLIKGMAKAVRARRKVGAGD